MDTAEPVLLVTTGTRGDVAPFVAHALCLMAQGRHVTLLSNVGHAALASRYGVPFQAIAEDDWPQNSRQEDDFFASNILPGYRAVYTRIAEEVAKAHVPQIVSRSGHWGAQFAAERWSLPFQRIALQPCAIHQGGHPISWHDFSLLNPWRIEIGLPSLEFSGLIEENCSDTLSFFPNWFAVPERDWPECGQCTGFVFLDDEDFAPDATLAKWLADVEAPIVISTGSGMQDIRPFIEVANALAARGQAVLFLSPYATDPKAHFHPAVLVRISVDHGYLLPKAAVLIHNGGIGTSAQAIRSGIRQIIVPLLYDQPDNAARVVALGLGQSVRNDAGLVPNICALI